MEVKVAEVEFDEPEPDAEDEPDAEEEVVDIVDGDGGKRKWQEGRRKWWKEGNVDNGEQRARWELLAQGGSDRHGQVQTPASHGMTQPKGNFTAIVRES